MKTMLLGLAALMAPIAFADSATPSHGAPVAPAPKHACCAECEADASASTAAAEALPARSLYQIDASWTDDAGRAFSLASLRGHPVVIAMFFASCEYACPVLVSDMQRLRESLPAGVRERARFVLVSFDSERDTPAALQSYRQKARLDSGWTLLHGDAASVQELAMVLGVKYKQDARGQFSHSNLITVLTDGGEVAFQRAGLMGDVSEAARAVVVAAR